MINLGLEQADRLAAKPALLVMHSENRVSFGGRKLVTGHNLSLPVGVGEGNALNIDSPIVFFSAVALAATAIFWL